LQIDAGRENGVGSGRINAEAAALAAYATIGNIVPDFTASFSTVMVGESIDFTDLSAGDDIVSWSWSFPGAETTTSTLQNPQGIVYNSAGVYNVGLEISDGVQSKTVEKTSYIYVLAGSSNWIKQVSGFGTPHRGVKSIAIVDENVAWGFAFDVACGEIFNEFTRTNNGGASWETGFVSGADIYANYDIANIFPLSYNKAWACLHTTATDELGPYGGIFVTEDGGITWTKQSTAEFNSPESYPVAVHFFNNNEGWCLGNQVDDEFEMYTTADAGINWERVPVAQIPDAIGAENPL